METAKMSHYSGHEESIKKIWYLYAMEFYSTIKKNEILLFADK
jgi:hypothetical protein